jgi:hypothetical protein
MRSWRNRIGPDETTLIQTAIAIMIGSQIGELSTTQLMSKILFHEGIWVDPTGELSASPISALEVSVCETGWLQTSGPSPIRRNDCRESMVEAESQLTGGAEESSAVVGTA